MSLGTPENSAIQKLSIIIIINSAIQKLSIIIIINSAIQMLSIIIIINSAIQMLSIIILFNKFVFSTHSEHEQNFFSVMAIIMIRGQH